MQSVTTPRVVIHPTESISKDEQTQLLIRAAPEHLARLPKWLDNGVMSAQEIDDYLARLDEPKRGTLGELRDSILRAIPEAEQGMSYGSPAFRLDGQTIAGFAAFKNHLSYLPHSGSVIPELAGEVASYATSKGALRFAVDTPLADNLVEKLVAVRIRQAFPET